MFLSRLAAPRPRRGNRGLLTDARRLAMRCRLSSNRSMTWERTAERYLSVFESVAGTTQSVARRNESFAASLSAPPMQLSHFLSMCDDTGLLQHAICSVPDRSHGYCVDDNARALLVACALNAPGEKRLSETLTSRFAAFVQHAWNPAHKRFRNFMSFDRRWLEDLGSEDSHGRTLWALGECVRSDASESRRQVGRIAIYRSDFATEIFLASRLGFSLLGLDAYCATLPKNTYARELRHLLADRLMALIT